MLMRSPGASGVPERSDSPPRRWLTVLVVVLMVPLGLVVGSYGRALAYPGQASFGVRSVEWLRDHGGSPLVDAVEDWWYTRQAPSRSAPLPQLSLPLAEGPGTPAPLPALGSPPSPGEGRWVAGPMSTRSGQPAMYSAYVRPDPVYPSVVAGVARFDQNQVGARLIAGTREPDGVIWPEGGQVPDALRPGLVAAFNSGFKLADAQGGYYADHHEVVALRDGAASLVIDNAGQVSVDQWGRDRRLDPGISSVRQNLALIVDNGQPVAGLNVNRNHRWGNARNQLQYTWRSALGVDAHGMVYYVAGDKLTLATLARALADTGAVRGMELDIHAQDVHLFAYRHPPGAADPQPTPLLGAMRGAPDRYLRPEQRDFLTMTLR